MKTRTTETSKPQKPIMSGKKLSLLTIAGGAAFWGTSIITSLLPIAARYRAAFSNWSIQTVWMGSLFAGLIVGGCVSYFLLRLFPEIPTNSPVLKSVILSFIALIIAIILNDVPLVFHARSNALYYFLIGVGFNTARFLFLGISVGYLYDKLYS